MQESQQLYWIVHGRPFDDRTFDRS